MIPLEDLYNDILSKAIRGRGLGYEEAAKKAGVNWADVTKLKDGHFRAGDEPALRKLAQIAGLDADTLIDSALGKWHPGEAPTPQGFEMCSTPYKNGIVVNSYLIWDADSRLAVAFDTGTDCDAMLETIEKNKLTLHTILLTHSHGDHILELDRLMHKTGCTRALIGQREPVEGVQATVKEGDLWQIARFRITALETWGHSAGGITYVVEGLSPARTFAFVGDSIFAGSMGGGMVSFEDAYQNNLRKILTLPDNTVLCSGHGPLTTVGEEKAHNPFFAARFR
ncbi:MBL fold metallo-hydrolase [Oscillatoria amoena NRMC-F 0135]|nr:MBL fold metallo-hydrolase [Oscillatoria laete-virens]MDL5051068.1 MBL fold metallo-hydrolase [Oscillatoria amoena NRMC-F 0135]MDL5054515.1 MBL fold metallo-hydrolase [Oscillatoria laete-virens NRMC-F 0139]